MSVNPDIQVERDTATFRSIDVTHMLDGSPEATNQRRIRQKQIGDDPQINRRNIIFMSHEERYEAAIARGLRIEQLKAEHDWDIMDENNAIMWCFSDIAMFVHKVMFIPAIERLGNKEQHDKWLPLAIDHKILGTYAQTELGHGTFLRGLEMEARYDKSTEEFVISTPKHSSMKWWPGSLGHSSSHAVLLATLYIDDQNCGMQPFIVQLRDLNTWKPLPGVEVGGIGPKMALATTDNGFLVLNNVRIPRDQMLMKYAQVSKDGKFTKSGAAKANYSTMMLVRVGIAHSCYFSLAVGATIVTRYSAVRRQGEIKPGAPEVKILDYQTQQLKVIPSIATAYAFHFCKEHLKWYYIETFQQIQQNDFSGLPEIHCVTSGLKAYMSDIATAQLETLRRACGGNGYLLSNGITNTYIQTLALPTVEGENTVLYLQVARYLMKCLKVAATGEAVKGSLSYMNEKIKTPYTSGLVTREDYSNVKKLLKLYQNMTVRLTQKAGDHLNKLHVSGQPKYEAWNNTSVQLVNAAKAYCQTYVLGMNIEGLSTQAVDLPGDALEVIHQLCVFYALHGITEQSGNFLETGCINITELHIIQQEAQEMMAKIRKNAVALVDAFDIPDNLLNSTLGCYDGNAYQHLYDSAKSDPMNQKQVLPAFEKYIKPMLQGKHTSKL
ncbi:unnamed protein product [Owenia fusiformis]|uniref:Acyl-coenzyme A oxidase n=1 Tax=Owenia fusiformis TaxID=6347 RepID=A0A8S4NQZ1_OWEFU|nr:unnamed protein product [Owenia fusiformis]